MPVATLALGSRSTEPLSCYRHTCLRRKIKARCAATTTLVTLVSWQLRFPILRWLYSLTVFVLRMSFQYQEQSFLRVATITFNLYGCMVWWLYQLLFDSPKLIKHISASRIAN